MLSLFGLAMNVMMILMTICQIQACPANTVPFGSDECQPISEAINDAKTFLHDNLPSWDKINSDTLFEGGIVGPTINISLQAKITFPWAHNVPRDIFHGKQTLSLSLSLSLSLLFN